MVAAGRPVRRLLHGPRGAVMMAWTGGAKECVGSEHSRVLTGGARGQSVGDTFLQDGKELLSSPRGSCLEGTGEGWRGSLVPLGKSG